MLHEKLTSYVIHMVWFDLCKDLEQSESVVIGSKSVILAWGLGFDVGVHCKKLREISGCDEIFYILTVVVFARMETFLKTQRQAHLRGLHVKYTITQLRNKNSHLNRKGHTRPICPQLSLLFISRLPRKLFEVSSARTGHRLVLSQDPRDVRQEVLVLVELAVLQGPGAEGKSTPAQGGYKWSQCAQGTAGAHRREATLAGERKVKEGQPKWTTE